MKSLLSILLLLLTAPAAAQSLCSFTPNSSGTYDWTDASRWSCGHVPTPADTVVLGGHTGVVVRLDEEATVAGLRLEGATLRSSATLTVTAHMRWTEGYLTSTGTTVVAPGATLAIIADASFLAVSEQHHFIHEGTGTWRGGQDVGLNSTDARFENRGTIEMTASRTEGPTHGVIFGNGRFVNAEGGVIRRSGAGASTMYAPFDNHGTIEVLEGEFRLRDFNGAGGTDSGAYVVSEGAVLVFDGNRTMTEAASVAGAGVVRTGSNSSGTTTINGTFGVPVLDLAGAVGLDLNTDVSVDTLRVVGISSATRLGGSGTITVTREMTWTGGTLRGSGTTVIAEGATLFLAPATNFTGFNDTRRLVNEGTATWTSGGNRLSNQMTNEFENRGTVTVSATNESAFADFFGGHFINAEGGVLRRVGQGTTRFSSGFENHGLVEILEGGIELRGFNATGGTDSGAYALADGTRLELTGGRRTLTETASIAGTGTVVINDGSDWQEVTNGATWRPGASPGTLTIESDYPAEDGALEIELAGTTPGTEHDQLVVTGEAELSGTLRLVLIEGFVPAVGDAFTVLTAEEVTGTFASVEAPAGYGFAVDVQAQAVVVEVTAAPEAGCNFTVTTAADAGMGSLRDALAEANADPDLSTICFAIPGAGPHTIALASALPAVTTPVVIDGYTQPGASPNTLEVGSDAVIQIELDAAGAATGHGLYLNGPGASGSVVRGLAVIHASQAGILVSSPPTQNDLTDVRIEGNVIGLRADGETVAGNKRGLWITRDVRESVVGGAAPAARNVIAGNEEAGIECGAVSSLGTADDIRIENNYVGTDRSGTVARGNGREGLRLENCRAEVVGNVVAANARTGLFVSAGASLAAPVAIRGNHVGVGADGETALGNGPGATNGDPGIEVSGGALVAGSVIGGTEPGEGNLIAHNARDGIRVRHIDANDPTVGVAILGNRIFANGDDAFHLGLDLDPNGADANDPGDADAGPNNLQNHPEIVASEIDAGGDLIVTYRVDSDPEHAAYPLRVELFGADARGQGAAFLGFDAYTEADWAGCGSAPCQKTVTLGRAADLGIEDGTPLVATATDAEGNTSEFTLTPQRVANEGPAGETLPQAFSLHAAYPNPFASRTTLAFDLPEAASVRLSVYDVLGRRVAVLAEEERPAGRHETVLDGAALPGGIYFVRIEAGTFAATQRVVLVR